MQYQKSELFQLFDVVSAKKERYLITVYGLKALISPGSHCYLGEC